MTWATSVPILIFLGLSVLDLGTMYATDRQTPDVRQKHRLMPRLLRAGHNRTECTVQKGHELSIHRMPLSYDPANVH